MTPILLSKDYDHFLRQSLSHKNKTPPGAPLGLLLVLSPDKKEEEGSAWD